MSNDPQKKVDFYINCSVNFLLIMLQMFSIRLKFGHSVNQSSKLAFACSFEGWFVSFRMTNKILPKNGFSPWIFHKSLKMSYIVRVIVLFRIQNVINWHNSKDSILTDKLLKLLMREFYYLTWSDEWCVVLFKVKTQRRIELHTTVASLEEFTRFPWVLGECIWYRY